MAVFEEPERYHHSPQKPPASESNVREIKKSLQIKREKTRIPGVRVSTLFKKNSTRIYLMRIQKHTPQKHFAFIEHPYREIISFRNIRDHTGAFNTVYRELTQSATDLSPFSQLPSSQNPQTRFYFQHQTPDIQSTDFQTNTGFEGTRSLEVLPCTYEEIRSGTQKFMYTVRSHPMKDRDLTTTLQIGIHAAPPALQINRHIVEVTIEITPLSENSSEKISFGGIFDATKKQWDKELLRIIEGFIHHPKRGLHLTYNLERKASFWGDTQLHDQRPLLKPQQLRMNNWQAGEATEPFVDSSDPEYNDFSDDSSFMKYNPSDVFESGWRPQSELLEEDFDYLPPIESLNRSYVSSRGNNIFTNFTRYNGASADVMLISYGKSIGTRAGLEVQASGEPIFSNSGEKSPVIIATENFFRFRLLDFIPAYRTHRTVRALQAFYAEGVSVRPIQNNYFDTHEKGLLPASLLDPIIENHFSYHTCYFPNSTEEISPFHMLEFIEGSLPITLEFNLALGYHSAGITFLYKKPLIHSAIVWGATENAELFRFSEDFSKNDPDSPFSRLIEEGISSPEQLRTFCIQHAESVSFMNSGFSRVDLQFRNSETLFSVEGVPNGEKFPFRKLLMIQPSHLSREFLLEKINRLMNQYPPEKSQRNLESLLQGICEH